MMYEPKALGGVSANETPGLPEYMAAIRNRKGIVFLLFLIGVALAYGFVRSRTDIYEANATVIANPSPVNSTNGNLVSPVLKDESAALQSDKIAGDVQNELGLQGTGRSLLADLLVRFETQSSILELTYTGESPTQIRDIVNGFATAYVNDREAQAAAYYEDQIAELEAIIDPAKQTLAEREEELGVARGLFNAAQLLDPPDPIATGDALATIELLNGQISGLRSQISTDERTLNNLRIDQSSRPVAAEIRNLATTPTTPTNIAAPLVFIAGGLLGLIAGIVIAFTQERLDRTASESEDIELALGSSVLASVPSFGVGNKAGSAALVMLSSAKSTRIQRGREAFRRLRTSIQFIRTSNERNSFLFTSARPGEGKSTTSANLAVAIAQSGSSVVLINADMRRPQIENLFGLQNSAGLSDWLAGNDDINLEVKLANVPNLSIVPAGTVPPNPGELLASRRFQSLIDHFEETTDFVIVDTPPVGSAADAASAAVSVGGVVIVVDSKRTEIESLLQVRADIARAGGEMLGAVMNRTRVNTGGLFRRDHYAYYEKAVSEAGG